MKTCNIEGCNSPVWSKGVCKFHTPKSSLKKSFISKPKDVVIYSSPEGHRVINSALKQEIDRAHSEKRNDFFMAIWAKRAHVCQHCGKKLGNEARTYMFDHLLEKQKYKNLEFEEENIWLVCLECHDEKTRGIISEKYREKINFVTTKFNVS